MLRIVHISEEVRPQIKPKTKAQQKKELMEKIRQQSFLTASAMEARQAKRIVSQMLKK